MTTPKVEKATLEQEVQTIEIPEKRIKILEEYGYYAGKTIGKGAFATIRVGTSEKHEGMNVAIKIISKLSTPTDYLEKFLPREIDVIKGLKHPNLVRFIEAIETTHRVYIIMEYAPNGNFIDLIQRDTYIDEIRARKWFKQLTEVVEYCHDRGIAHRDIKCENLLLDGDNNLKLSDFGFARGHLKLQQGQPVLSESFCGSNAYLPPEVLKGIPYEPQKADIWAMGVVLFSMVFGRLPFNDSNYERLVKLVSKKLKFPNNPKVSTSCQSLIHKILAPLEVRIEIPQIKTEPWYTIVDPVEPDTSDPMPSTSKQPEPGVGGSN